MSKGNILKKGRIIISLLFFISITLLFIDFREFIPSHYADSILFLQFTPSLLKFINIVSITTVGFIIVLILTLLFGRVYCSTICPLGIFQDIISFISKKIKKRKIFRYQKAKNILRYSILGVTILFFISGNIFFISLLDPYSVYGRIATDMFRPVIIGLNNIFSGFLEKASVFYLYPIDLIYFNPLTLIIPAVFLLLVLWLSFYHGRLYCNTVCPVGAFLGL